MAQVDITPESAGWRYAGLKTAEFAGSYQFFTAQDEALVLPLSGSCIVRCGTEEFLPFETDRLPAVEVLTPGGNWSSWPPHKHDEERGRRVQACSQELSRSEKAQMMRISSLEWSCPQLSPS